MTYSLSVNGRTHSVDVDADTPLLWVLRDVIGLTGTKFGCGVAQCGACTVHLDGMAVRSCVTPVESVGGSDIVTIEAVGATPLGGRVQQAPGSTRRSCSAATASPGRSCRRWR